MGKKRQVFRKWHFFSTDFIVRKCTLKFLRRKFLASNFSKNLDFRKPIVYGLDPFRKSADPPLQGGRFLIFCQAVRGWDFFDKNAFFCWPRSGVPKISIFSDFLIFIFQKIAKNGQKWPFFGKKGVNPVLKVKKMQNSSESTF